jgi:stage II sporulation protein AB (anti-sigma F factor)
MQFESKSVNESFARAAVAAFVSRLDPTVEELNDIKTAVSEAVTNCIVHAYDDSVGKIYIAVSCFDDGNVRIKIRDTGKGIADIKKAREPLFTTGGSDRAGLGFSVMETFSDRLAVRSAVGKGTTVTLYKKIEGRKSDKG